MYLKSFFCTCTQFLHFAYFKKTRVFFHVVLPGFLDASLKWPSHLRSFVIHALCIVTDHQFDIVQLSVALFTVKSPLRGVNKRCSSFTHNYPFLVSGPHFS